MKKFIAGIIVGVLGAGILSVGAVGTWENIGVLRNDIKVVVNGQEIQSDNFLYNDTTYLPIRAVSTALGESVDYDEATNIAYIGERKDNETVIKSKYTPNNKELQYCELDNGIYYIMPDYIIDLAKAKGIDTNVDELHKNQEDLSLVLGDRSWEMVRLSVGRYILYDTYVDEIEPLLK